MEIFIWIVKGLLALLFAFVGLNKLFLPKTKLLDKGMKGLINIEEKQIKIIGFLEVLGAMGLILPSLLHIYPILTGISALCLGLTMIIAIRIHLQLKLPILPNIIILALCILATYWSFM